ncbi:hypothetical protein INT48_003690 [Thamnidium elegans]|uniref:Uncharacterized protein n=1 Tax=Thamnidium elegans TaxID=101142 RepID=A0A8H7VSM4_9FUNG|nr:hypothetical protein INT48_003690 [Thamnidium elegans]
MPFISSLKESFAIAPIENREDVVLKLATANTEDANYYQGLILLQKIYNEVMKQEEPTKVREATDAERALFVEMQSHLKKFQNKNDHYIELNTRFHLLVYPFETLKSTEFIKNELCLDLITQKQEQQSVQTDQNSINVTPSKLDQDLISRNNIIKGAFDVYRLNGSFDITPLAFPHLKASALEIDRLPDSEQVVLLQKLFVYPTEKVFGNNILNRLCRLWKILADNDESWKFENLPFYNFTLAQMDYLIKNMPDIVLLHENFVNAYVDKLVPSQYYNVDSAGQVISFWDDEEGILRGYLNDLDHFAQKLPDIYFHLKSAIRFYKLRVDIVRQDFEELRLIQYLTGTFNKSTASSPIPSRLSNVFSFNKPTQDPDTIKYIDKVNIRIPLLGGCQIREQDRLLVIEEYLTGLITQNKLTASMESLGAYIDYHNVLKPLHAKLMLTVSSVMQESWARVLGSTKFEQLVKKSSVVFTPATLNSFVKRGPNDTVKLSVRTKNIQLLSIRVFQINMENYSRLHLGSDNERVIFEKNNKIDLDGLCPTWEKDIDFSSEPAIRVKTNDFVFGSEGLASEVFNGRGLWVVEFVGGQNQCRAIVQKGYLGHVIQNSTAGHVVRILDESGKVLENSKIWCENQYYEADAYDNILIPYLPFDGNSKTTKILLISASDDFCETVSFDRLAEKYTLSADFYINPEMVSFNKKATVVINPRLTMNSLSIPISLLENISLVVESTNADQVKNTSTCQNISKDSSSIYFEFMVPDRLINLDFTLNAKIRTLNDTLEPTDFKHSISYRIPIENIGVPESVHLKKSIDGNYFIHVFGLNGEPKANYEVSLKIKHAFVTYNQVNVILKTNSEGVIELGPLPDIQWVEYSSAQVTYKQWSMNNDKKCVLPPAVCVAADTPFIIACSADVSGLLFSLYKTGIRESLVIDLSDVIQVNDRHVSISGLPAGEYMFYFASTNGGESQIKCSVIKGQVNMMNEVGEECSKNERFWSDWVIGKNSYAKQNGTVIQRPLYISDIDVSNNESVTVQLKNWSAKTFLILTTSTFVPTNTESLAHLINGRNLTRPLVLNNGIYQTESLFLDNKQLGEEYQYVLNRARSEKWVGSNLTKPTLLMFPEKHASTTTESRQLESEKVTKNTRKDLLRYAKSFRNGSNRAFCTGQMFTQNFAESSLAFLDHNSPILVLPISTDGSVTVTREQLGYGGDFIQALAISGEQAAYQDTVMPSDFKLRLNDLRQKQSSNKALIRSKVIKNLLPNEKLVLDTHEYETIDSFEKLFETIKTISRVGSSVSQSFEYLKTWPNLDVSKKLKLYEKNVCYELNFWLKRKDAVFFDQFVKPAIMSKIQKSFMDLYLIDEDLSEFSNDIYKLDQLSIAEKALLATTQSPQFLKTILRSFEEAFDDRVIDDRCDATFDSILAGSALVLPEVITETSSDNIGVLERGYVAGNAAFSPSSAQCAIQYQTYMASSPPPPPLPSSQQPGMLGMFKSAGFGGPSSSRILKLAESYADVGTSLFDSIVDDNDEELEELADEMRERAKKLQQKIAYEFTEPTSEWVEASYYNKHDHIAVKKFWIDFLQYHLAKSDSQQNTFLSENFMYCLDNSTEVFFVLSMLDLPFVSESNWTKEAIASNNAEEDGSAMQLTICASSSYPLMVFYRTLTESSTPFNGNSENNLMLGQELFIYDESTPIDSDECIKINPLSKHLDTFVQYGSHVIVSNVSGKTLSCQVTVQIPTGAIPCKETPYCRSKTISIHPYSTWHEVTGTFYFPSEGSFTIVPVTVSSLSGDKLLGKIDSINFDVKDKPCNNSNENENEAASQLLSLSSWPTLANSGSSASVISFLEGYKKLDRLDFGLIGWRMKDNAFARQVFDVLSHQRCFYSQTLWKYGVYHQFDDIIRDLLKFDGNSVLTRAGQVFESPLIEKKREDHSQIFDYYPLLNARAHPLKSASHEILNNQFYKQYDEFLSYLSQRTNQPTNNDLVILTLYLILQDRIGDAQLTFARIQSGENPTFCQVQIDYTEAYLKTRIPVTDQTSHHLLDLDSVKQIALKYKEFGVLKWRKLFTELYEFVCEVEQGDSEMTGTLTGNSTRIQSEPLLQFEINQQTQELVVEFANIKSIDVKYYEMNIEVMFSTNPFMNDRVTSAIDNKNFTWIKPSYSSRIELPEKSAAVENDTDGEYNIIGVGQVKSVQTINIPFTGGNKNVFVEISSVGTVNDIKRCQAYFSHSLQTHIVESFGIVRVMSGSTRRPLAGTYVKVYARMKQGRKVHFWKDGYTGLNGVFDYIGVTEGNALMGGAETDLKALMYDKIDKLSILVISPEEGAVVKETYPPLTA